MNFYESIHCTSQQHCAKCRGTAPAFRQQMLRLDPTLGMVDFPCPQGRRWGWQFGDLVAKVATPVARALGLDCVDKESQKLKPESPCAKRKAALNAMRLASKPTEQIPPITQP